MAFQGAQNTDARYGIFSELHPGSNQNITVTNNIYSEDDHRQRVAVGRFDSQDRQPCLEGTRKDILDKVDRWINTEDSKEPRIFWINGLAGTGKTTIAFTIAKKCRDNGTPSASFFCSRDDADASNPNLVFTTIARQLGHFHAPFQQLITRAHNADPGLTYSSISNQLEELLVKPIRAVRHDFPPCIIILDAIDECKDDNTTSTILSSLSQHIEALSPLKFLVTSRPEHRIFGGFRLLGLRLATRRLNLHEVELSVVERDIEHYLTTCFSDMRERCEFDDSWPTSEDVQALTRLSSGLFIFASTAVKFIQDPNYSDPKGQLARLLKTTIIEGSSPHNHLDRLYMHVLTGAFPNISTDLSLRLKRILGTIALLQYPLYPVDIEHLLKLEPGTIRNTVMHLGSVLDVPKDDHEMIRLIHPSFFDFLTDAARCPDPHFIVDSGTQHGFLAQACLSTMKRLKRDICGIGDPSILDGEVMYLSERIARHIPPDLQYACRNWTYHLSRTRISDVPLELLRVFCSKHLLQWAEVCSLLGELRSAVVGLNDSYRLISKMGSTTYDVLELLEDTKRFIRDFFPALCASSSHTYYSALLFTPSQTALRQKYNHELKRSVKVHLRAEKQWDACLRTMEGHEGWIWSVAISPDGSFVASGSADGSVRIWDFMTGALLLCIASESKRILSVAFSPCGSHLVSGSDDKTLQLWDVKSKTRLSEFIGHTGIVNSVAFSPGGSHIISGSRDRTVRIWATTGVLQKTLEGHSSEVKSVAYSPDGNHIISGSYDKTIRIWQATGSHINTIQHPSQVNSVAFSLGGAHIVSGSEDNTIRIWSMSGTNLKTFTGHASAVTTVAYSPDGSHIVSGSQDGTIRIWDSTGVHLKTLGGHCGVVTSVAYSPDGTQIVSGTFDRALRIWDATVGTEARPGVVQSYFGWVSGLLTPSSLSSTLRQRLVSGGSRGRIAAALSPSHIATYDVLKMEIDLWDINGTHLSKLLGQATQMLFSPNGAYFAIISHDHTIRLCSGLSGAHLRSLEGGWRWVYSASFSPSSDCLAFGSADTTIRLWDLSSDTSPRILRGHSDNVFKVIFSPCGSYIVSASDDSTVRLWSMATGTQLRCVVHVGPSLHDIYVSRDQKSIVGTSSFGEIPDLIAVPEELWPTDSDSLLSRRVDRYELSSDGWLYAEHPKRRVCWLPSRSRPDIGTFSDNGCFLGLFFKWMEILHISQP